MNNNTLNYGIMVTAVVVIFIELGYVGTTSLAWIIIALAACIGLLAYQNLK